MLLQLSTRSKLILTVIATLLVPIIALFSSIIIQATVVLEAENILLISNNLRLETQIAEGQKLIDAFTSLSNLTILPGAKFGWKEVLITCFCIGCILTSIVGAAAFFQSAPYIIPYSSSDWYCGIFSYLFPIAWLKDSGPLGITDSVGNEYPILFDSVLDTFVMKVKILGYNNSSSIQEFLQVLLHLHD